MCAVSPYFFNVHEASEQDLLDELVQEVIQIHGIDVYYLPRILGDYDKIYGEDTISSFKNNYLVDVYVKNVEGFGGEGDFLSKFNLQIRDQMILTIAKRTFEDEIGQYEGITRPREGDLIFLPLNNKIFEIKFVEHEPVFYQLGSLQMYDITCELFEYSNEKFDTGITVIDELEQDLTTNLVDFGVLGSDGYQLIASDGYPVVHSGFDFTTQNGEAFEDNTDLQTESDNTLDWSHTDPFSESGRF